MGLLPCVGVAGNHSVGTGLGSTAFLYFHRLASPSRDAESGPGLHVEVGSFGLLASKLLGPRRHGR